MTGGPAAGGDDAVGVRLPRRWRDERGSVTAELAVGLPAVVLALLLVLGVGAAGVTRLRCEQAARQAARVATLGEDDDEVRAAARRVAGASAAVVVERDGSWVTVRVGADVVPAGLGDALRVEAAATGWSEP